MKIICVGWNYPKHNEEMNRFNLPAEPTIFLKLDNREQIKASLLLLV